MIDYFSKDIQNSKDWKDWKWQFRNRLRTVEDFEKYLNLSTHERQGLIHSIDHFSTGVTPYVLSLMDRESSDCPIRKQFIPSIHEETVTKIEMVDPCHEDQDSPVPGIVHRYPDRVLFLVTDLCAVYCRYCTRSRLVGQKSGFKFNETIEKGLEYIRKHPEVRDVLISGGDPLLLNDDKLDVLLKEIRSIEHVEIIRIGTRIPLVIPQRITKNLTSILEKYHPLYLSLHVNHPHELTDETYQSIERLTKSGIPLGSQTVLIKGVNDSPVVMKKLVHKLLQFRIRPYYLYQCDPVQGTSHLRTSLSRGMEIMRKLRGYTTGYAVPTYVVDAPGGGGKIPIEPGHVVSQRDGVIRIRNWAGKEYEYHEEIETVSYQFV